METYPHQSSEKTKSNPQSNQASRFRHTESGRARGDHRVEVSGRGRLLSLESSQLLLLASRRAEADGTDRQAIWESD